jgi:hypothetical protein
MPGPCLIRDYLGELSAQLPAGIVAELASGLDETCGHYLGQGLDPDAATRAAIAEFGDPQVVVEAFTRTSPARQAARRLLATGPVAGLCWGAALVGGRAWTWSVPVTARVLFGAALITVAGLLAAAAVGRRYRAVSRAGTAGCVGIAALDAAMLAAVTFAAPVVAWPLILAAGASAARISFTAWALRPVLAS